MAQTDGLQPAHRFVVLRHTVGEGTLMRGDQSIGDHYDWMFETHNSKTCGLVTLSTLALPTFDQSVETVTADWIADHRIDFLDVRQKLVLSGDRGSVDPVLAGTVGCNLQPRSLINAEVRFDWSAINIRRPPELFRLRWRDGELLIERLPPTNVSEGIVQQ